MDKIFRIPATLSKYQGMSHRSLRLQFDTQENLTDEEISTVTKYHEKFLWLVLLHEETKESEILEAVKSLPPLIREIDSKTPSQRLRAVLYVYWKQEGEKGEFELFYRKTLETIISKFKEKLN